MTNLERTLRELHRCCTGGCSETYPCDVLNDHISAARLALEAAAEVAESDEQNGSFYASRTEIAKSIRALLGEKP